MVPWYLSWSLGLMNWGRARTVHGLGPMMLTRNFWSLCLECSLKVGMSQ